MQLIGRALGDGACLARPRSGWRGVVCLVAILTAVSAVAGPAADDAPESDGRRASLAGHWGGILWSDAFDSVAQYATYMSLDIRHEGSRLAGTGEWVVPDYSHLPALRAKVAPDRRLVTLRGLEPSPGKYEISVSDGGSKIELRVSAEPGATERLVGFWRQEQRESTIELRRGGDLVAKPLVRDEGRSGGTNPGGRTEADGAQRTIGEAPPPPSEAGNASRVIDRGADVVPGRGVGRAGGDGEGCPLTLASLSLSLPAALNDAELRDRRARLISRNMEAFAKDMHARPGGYSGAIERLKRAAEDSEKAMRDNARCLGAAVRNPEPLLAQLARGKFDFAAPGPMPVDCARAFVANLYEAEANKEQARILTCYADREGASSAEELRASPGRRLFMSLERGNVDGVRGALSAGADVDQPDIAGWTPLMVAFARDDVEASRVLINHNADIWAKNSKGLTAIDIATRERSQNVMRLLDPKDAGSPLHRLGAAFEGANFPRMMQLVEEGDNWTSFVPPEAPNRPQLMRELRHDKNKLRAFLEKARQAYEGRLVLTEMVSALKPTREAISRFRAAAGRFPSTNQEAGVGRRVGTERGEVAADLQVVERGQINVRITESSVAELKGTTLILSPAWSSAERAVTWSCDGGSVPPGLLPRVCGPEN